MLGCSVQAWMEVHDESLWSYSPRAAAEVKSGAMCVHFFSFWLPYHLVGTVLDSNRNTVPTGTLQMILSNLLVSLHHPLQV